MEDFRKMSGLLSGTKALLREYRIAALKRFGQNFLVDDFVKVRIIDTAVLNKGDTVVEIGPGLGALTASLAERAKEVIAIEYDERFCTILTEGLKDYPNIKIVHDDALKFDYTSLRAPFKVVANLPYCISTPILLKLFEQRGKISEMVLMFQKEIAERLTALHGTRDYGFLTVMSRYHADVDICFPVSKKAFLPSPKVDSAVLKFRFLKKPRVNVSDESLFFDVAKASMAYKRKTLRNNLKRAEVIADKKRLDEIFARTGIDSKRRGETLTLDEYARLANLISSEKY